MVDVRKFDRELAEFERALKQAKRVLITAPGAADGDSIGSQLALRRMILHRFPKAEVRIINDEPLPPRYQFLPDIEFVDTPETYWKAGGTPQFDVGILVDGGIDRAGRVQEMYHRCPQRVFIDHHAVSIDYPYTIRIVEPTASATTELVYQLSRTSMFGNPIEPNFAQQIYLGLVFDTSYFRHSNTTPEVMELAADLLRSGFDFTRVGERGMLERSYSSLKLLADTLNHAQLRTQGKIIWSSLTQKMLRDYNAHEDDREGIIDHLLLTHGIEVAVLFFEQKNGQTKISLRSHGAINVAEFARGLTEHGGGHIKAAGASLDIPVEKAIGWVLDQLEAALMKRAS